MESSFSNQAHTRSFVYEEARNDAATEKGIVIAYLLYDTLSSLRKARSMHFCITYRIAVSYLGGIPMGMMDNPDHL